MSNAASTKHILATESFDRHAKRRRAPNYISSTATAKPQTAARHRDASIKTSWNLFAREAACACYGRNVVDRATGQCFVSRICQFGLMGMDIVVPGGAPSKAVAAS